MIGPEADARNVEKPRTTLQFVWHSSLLHSTQFEGDRGPNNNTIVQTGRCNPCKAFWTPGRSAYDWWQKHHIRTSL